MPEQPSSPDPLLDYSTKHPVQRDYAGASQVAQYCAYCNAPLDPFFYFCMRCSTPYKPLQSITGTVRPTPISDGERVKRMAPHTWTVFWTYAAVVLGCLLVSGVFSILGQIPVALFHFLSTMAILVTTIIFTTIHWRPVSAQLRTSGFTKWEAWAGLAALIPLLAINFAMMLVVRKFSPEADPDLLEGISLPVGILVFCVFPAITEEIAFRGLVQYWLEISITPGKALLLGSAMFAGLHLSVYSFPYLFAVGVVLALVRRRTGSLYPGILIHFLHNLAVITLFRLNVPT